MELMLEYAEYRDSMVQRGFEPASFMEWRAFEREGAI